MRPDTRSAAEGRWQGILVMLGIMDRKKLDGHHYACPACGGVDRFRFDDKYRHPGDGGFYCSGCGPGDGFTLIMRVRKCSFAEAARMVDGVLGREDITRNDPPPVPNVTDIRRRLGATIRNAVPIHHQRARQAREYLMRRGLPLSVLTDIHDLLYAERTMGAGVEGYMPAMLGLIRGSGGGLESVHKTFLCGNRKASIKSPKQIASPVTTIRGAAVRLYQAGTTLAVTEGIETALAVRALTSLPVWACLSAGGLSALDLPPGITHLAIYADHDENGIGQAAAGELFARAWRAGVNAEIHLPRELGDWLDVWVAKNKLRKAA